jgi:hypothetical protein
MCSSLLGFLMASAGVWKGSISGTSRDLLLGTSAPVPLVPRLCLLRPLGSLWCGFRAHHSVHGPHCRNEAWEEKPVGGGGAVRVAEVSTVGPHQPASA